jgi:hypothetical protein
MDRIVARTHVPFPRTSGWQHMVASRAFCGHWGLGGPAGITKPVPLHVAKMAPANAANGLPGGVLGCIRAVTPATCFEGWYVTSTRGTCMHDMKFPVGNQPCNQRLKAGIHDNEGLVTVVFTNSLNPTGATHTGRTAKPDTGMESLN